MRSETVLFDLQSRTREIFGGRRLLERLSDSRRGIRGNNMLSTQMAGNSICLAHRPQSVRSGSQFISFSELLPR